MADTTPPVDTYADVTQPAQSPPPLRQPLVRSRDSRLVAGVADGLAAAWGWRSWLVRLGFIVATAFAGLGIVLYTAGWLLIPEEGQPESVAQRMVRSMNIQRAWVGFGLLLAGGLIVGRVANLDGGILVAGALLVTGYALYTGAFALPPQQEPIDGREASPPVSVYQRETRPPRPARPKSYLGRLTLGAMLVTLGVMGATDALGTAKPTSRHYAATALLVIGLGLLLGFRFGRSRGLAILGLLLMPVVAIGAIADYRIGTTWEYLTLTPDSLDELQSSYELGSGNITIDLTRLDFAGRTVVLDLSSGIGNIYVDVPVGVGIEGTANAVLGQVGIAGARSSGVGAEVVRSTGGDNGRLIVDADVRIGSVEIYPTDLHGFFPDPVIAINEEAIERLVGVDGVNRPVIINDGVVQVLEGVGFDEPRRVSEIAGMYEILDGRLVLDLTAIDEPEAVVNIGFVGYGEATVIVPHDARIIAAGDIPNADLERVPDDGVAVWERPGDGITLVISARGPTVSIEEA